MYLHIRGNSASLFAEARCSGKNKASSNVTQSNMWLYDNAWCNMLIAGLPHTGKLAGGIESSIFHSLEPLQSHGSGAEEKLCTPIMHLPLTYSVPLSLHQLISHAGLQPNFSLVSKSLLSFSTASDDRQVLAAAYGAQLYYSPILLTRCLILYSAVSVV